MTLISFLKKFDCADDFEIYDALTEHYMQSQDHHYSEESDRHFNFEDSRTQHMDDKHWYCREHDQVSTPSHWHISCCDLSWRLITSRYSSPGMTSIRTIQRAWTTTIALIAKSTFMMKTSYGITLRIMTLARSAIWSVCIYPFHCAMH